MVRAVYVRRPRSAKGNNLNFALTWDRICLGLFGGGGGVGGVDWQGVDEFTVGGLCSRERGDSGEEGIWPL